jgi:hypothetical protein
MRASVHSFRWKLIHRRGTILVIRKRGLRSPILKLRLATADANAGNGLIIATKNKRFIMLAV